MKTRLFRIGRRTLAALGALAAVTVAAAMAALLAAAAPRHGRAPARLAAHRAAATMNARVRPERLRTSCRSVAHIGDSTSVDLISAADIPGPAQRLGARYAQVGVRRVLMDASGGRSIVEALPGQVNGYDVARRWSRAGYRGCWVFALGTNDAANVAAGSPVGLKDRIGAMMAVTRGQPVLWVDTVTRLSGGYWSIAHERQWDRALVSVLRTYPNMRIFDWAALARPGWFLPDGIHYNPLGCRMRAHAIAQALARAFPMNGRSKGQVVR